MAAVSNSTPDATAGKPPRRWRLIPLSLRIFVWIHLLLGIGTALWIGVPAFRQQVALRGIGINHRNVAIDIRWIGQGWLRQSLGNERMKMFDEVKGVTLADDAITDGALAHLKGLPDLKTLVLSGAQLTDAGLSQLDGLSNLRNLNLHDAEITDEGLKHLGRLKNLEYLSLANVQITDAGLVHLKELTNLKCLQVFRTSLTSAGVANWKRSRSPKAWPVYVTGIDDLDRLRQNPSVHSTSGSSSGMSYATAASNAGE